MNIDMAPAFLHSGLSDPADARSSCGVGALVELKRSASHQLVEDAFQVLVNLDHRGARGAEEKTGECKYLNNIIEPDHRRIKRLTRPMPGFKNFNSAQSTLAGIELVAMIKKGQMKKNISRNLSFADQFYALAA